MEYTGVAFLYSHTFLVKSMNPGWAARPPADVTISLAGEDDVELFEKAGMRRRIFFSRLRAGDRSAVVLANGEILTMIWDVTGRMFSWSTPMATAKADRISYPRLRFAIWERFRRAQVIYNSPAAVNPLIDVGFGWRRPTLWPGSGPSPANRLALSIDK